MKRKREQTYLKKKKREGLAKKKKRIILHFDGKAHTTHLKEHYFCVLKVLQTVPTVASVAPQAYLKKKTVL